jgi:transketolase
MEECEMPPDNNDIKKIEVFSNNIRKLILEMAFEAGASSAHFGGALSIAEILAVLFSYKMKLKKSDDIEWSSRDRFILSKGHACLAYYASLNLTGFINDKELKTFEKDNSSLAGHPVKNKKLGIDFSNGSLGMGLSIGIGLAISSKKKSKPFNVYVVLGDGECNEGSVWEAAMAAPKFKLDNLNVIIDKNNFQQTGSNNEIMDLGNLYEKWKSFGWDVVEVDGHNLNELKNYFDIKKDNKKPRVLIANTIKGKGFSFSENNNAWHHSVITKSIYEQGIKELKYGN